MRSLGSSGSCAPWQMTQQGSCRGSVPWILMHSETQCSLLCPILLKLLHSFGWAIAQGTDVCVQWRKQYAEFHKTTAGKVVFYGAIWFLFSTGIAFRLLNLLFIMWWVAPLFILPAINYMNRKVRD